MFKTYRIIENQLVRAYKGRPEASVDLNPKTRKTVETYLAAIDSDPFVENDVLICNELDRILAQV